MKGISSIIAVVMLLMITVSLVAVFWAFSSGVFSSLTSSVGSQTDANIKRAGSEFIIINAINTTFTGIQVSVRNSGTQNLDLDTLIAFVDDKTATETAAGKLVPGNAYGFTVTSPFSMSACNHILRLSVAYAPDAYYMIKC